MDTRFSAAVWEWRGPAPYFWVTVPVDDGEAIKAESSDASYGWGVIPVHVRIGATSWETSLVPKDGGYLLPLKKAVRTSEGIDAGDTVSVSMSVAPRAGRAANGDGPTI